MKIIQNNIWKRYLMLGLIISFGLILNSCKTQIAYGIKADFRFVNKTGYNITYDQAIFQEFNVSANDITIFSESQKTNGEIKNANPSDYRSPFIIPATDNVTVKFGSNKCLLMQSKEGINNIRDINNFVSEKLGNNYFKFTYTFTEADYNRAVTCP